MKVLELILKLEELDKESIVYVNSDLGLSEIEDVTNIDMINQPNKVVLS